MVVTFSSAIKFARILQTSILRHLIDIQSFLWVQGSTNMKSS